MSRKLTEEEAKAQGLEPGQWTPTPGLRGRPPFLNEQVAALVRLRQLLEAEEQQLQQKLQGAREALFRLTRGGGS